MKRTKTKNRCLVTCLTLIAMLMTSIGVKAQDVYIRPGSGHLISAVAKADDSGTKLGLSALWRHEQLALSMTGTDRDDITEAGEIAVPSTVFGERDSMLTIVGGRRPSFIVVSLPKGYRITGYDIVLVNNLNSLNNQGNIVGLDYNPNADFSQNTDRNAFHNINGNRGNNPGNGHGSNQVSDNAKTVNGTRVGTMRFYETTKWVRNGTNSPAIGYSLNDVRIIDSTQIYKQDSIGSRVINVAKNGNDIDIDCTPDDFNKEFTMSRHDDNMGNQLYFRLVKNYTFYGISIKSFKIYFTAEGNFDAPVAPQYVDLARRVVTSPFETNKIDIGKLQKKPAQDGGNSDLIFAYDYRNVTDLVAYNYIYQKQAVKDGVPYEVETVTPHIYPVKINGESLYAFEADTFYVEPPTSINTSSGQAAPIGFRIVGAKFEYLWRDSTDITKKIPSSFHIVYNRKESTSDNEEIITSYYLRYRNSTFEFVRQSNNPAANSSVHTPPFDAPWHMTDDGNIYYDTNRSSYLSCEGTGSSRRLYFSNDANSIFNLRTEDGSNLYYYSDGFNYYNMQVVLNDNRVPTGVNVVKDALNDLAFSQYQAGGDNVTVSRFVPGNYRLDIYDNTGDNIKDSIFVDQTLATSSNNYIELDTVRYKLNNDAIKFVIRDLGSNKKALLRITLQLQALNPYINSMLVECKNIPKALQMSQTFTASDFSVSGGSFVFYVPDELKGDTMDISFSKLYSNYGDKTYYGETASLTNSRYSFVTSDYFKRYDGYTSGNNGLYDPSYTPNSDYTEKVTTETAGNVRYEFNNAEELGSGTSLQEAYLFEYPFSVRKYLSNYHNPDTIGPAIAKFDSCKVVAGDGSQKAGSFFVFTADETRYNIAPTDSMQHRQYAFYRMDVKAIAKSYEPVLYWTRVYDKALYSEGKDETTGKDIRGEKSQFGLRLGTRDTTDHKDIVGYLTVKQINDTINSVLAAQLAAEQAAGGNNSTLPSVPSTRDQILYIDGSELLGVYNFSESGDTLDLADLMEGLGANALIFLPKDITTQLDNFAYYEPDIRTFRAGNNIVLTDKQPFYSPHEIQVDPANTATYTRLISADINGKADLATVMLPFTLSVDNTGLHKNPDDSKACEFWVNTMKDGAVMQKESSVNYGTAFFEKLTGKEKTEANKPYMIQVKDAESGSDFSFVVAEKAARILPTPSNGVNSTIGTGMLHTYTFGENKDSVVNASTADYTYKFINKATFSGAVFDRDKSEDVFYFAANKYLDLHTLNVKDENGKPNQWLYIYPFRGVYTYERTAKPGGAPGAKRMQWFDISFDEELPFAGITTDLDEVGTKADLMIRSDRGMLIISASRDQEVCIRSINGVAIKDVDMKAGDTKTVSLPSGIYLVNNVKILVK